MRIVFSNEFFCAFWDCVELRSCPNFSFCLACVENMVLMAYGENKKCGNGMCNIRLPSFNDVYVHQPRGDHGIVKVTWERKSGVF